VNITYKTNPPLTSADLNALFSAGRDAPETSDWQPVLAHSLVYLCAYDGGWLIRFANVAWDGRVHAFLLDPRVHPDWRHKGIGTKLVALAAEAAKAAGCTVLHVDFRDDLALFYFDSCSFKPTLAGLIHLT
jgi:GNAT superfamily N-acetyltransferase